MVNVYDMNGEIIASVKGNKNLTTNAGGFNDGLGLTKLENNKYVLIKGSTLDTQPDTAEIITDKKAFDLIMSYNPDLLEENKFKELKAFTENLIKEIV